MAPRSLRRFFLLWLGLIACASSALAQSAADYAVVRARFRAALNGGEALNASDPVFAGKISALNNSAQTSWNNLIKTSGRTQLWPDLAISPTASDTLTPNFTRLRDMAVAYATPGAALYRNATLRDDILSALEWLNANHYRAGKPFYGNWFPWHLAVPLNVADIFACIHDGITDTTRRAALHSAYAAAIDHYQNTAGRTWAWSGANLVWRAKIDLGLGAALEAPSRLALGRDRLSARAGVGNERNVFALVTSGDGFYADGSFVQHNTHAYTGGYGLYLLNELAIVLEAVADTPWSITDPGLANVFRWVDDAFDPVMFRGAIMSHTQGREISRSGSAEHGYGHVVLGAVARIARFAPAADAARFRALVKQHVQFDASRAYLANAPLGAAAIVKPILDDPTLPARTPRQGLFVFGGMDRVVAQRGDWAYAVSLSSKRISKYESINGENLRGWYLGDGAAYLYNGDLTQFSDAYWPTVDPYRLAGVTLDKRPRADAGTSSPNTIDPRTSRAWVGGSSVDGLYGAAGMDHEAAQSDLRGKLSWFFFDDEVVHLGAGLTTSSTNPHRVESVVMNRMTGHTGNNSGGAGGVTFTANGTPRATTSGATEPLTAVTYAHLNAPFQSAYGMGNIGYVFPEPASLQARRETRTGRWRDITTSGSTNAINRSYVSLWFDHGTALAAPGASFAYVVLPNVSAAQTAAYSQNPDIEILSNTPAIQAVRENGLRVLGANFWNASPAAPATIAGLSADRPVSVSLRQRDGRLLLGVSDPTQELPASAPLILELPAAATALVSADAGITLLALAPRVRISVNLAQTRGRSLAAAFTLAPLTAAPDTAVTSPGVPVSINVLANDSSASFGTLAVTSTTFAPPEPVPATAHGAAILNAATAASFPVGVSNFQVAPGASSPAAISALAGFTAITAWRDTTRAFAPKGSVNTGITNYHLRSDAGKTALRFQIETTTTSNPSAGGATTSASLTGSANDALYVGAVGGAFGHLAISVGAYSAVSQDAATLGFRTTSALNGRPYAVRALGFVVTGVGAGRVFTADFYGLRGQLLASQTATGATADTRLFFAHEAGGNPHEWITSIVLRGNNGSANLGLDDVGHTPVTGIDTGTLTLVDGLPVYTAPSGYTGPARFSYTVTDGVGQASAEVTITVSGTPVAIASATATTWQEPNTPDKVVDGITDASISRWSGFGDGATLTLTLAERQKVASLNLSTFEGTIRRALFEIETSDDNGLTWTRVFSGGSSGTTSDLERIVVTPSWARLVRIVGRGYVRNTDGFSALWNSFGEVQVIAEPNNPPLAAPYSAAARAGESVVLDLIGLGFDPDGGPAPLSVVALGTPPVGSLQQLDDGRVAYTPPADHRGTVAFSYTLGDGVATASALVTLRLGVPADVIEFLSLHFDSADLENPAVSDLNADPDGDGVTNLLEYAFATDPQSGRRLHAPLVSSTSSSRVNFHFRRSRHATDLTYVVETSADLAAWSPLASASGLGAWQPLAPGTGIEQLIHDEATWTVTIDPPADFQPSPATPRRFFRLRVTH